MSEAAAPTRRLTVGEALREAVAEEMRRDESVFLIGEDVAWCIKARNASSSAISVHR